MSLFFAVLPKASGDVADVWNTFLVGDFPRVRQQVNSLSAKEEFSDWDKAILWLTLGCSEAMLGDSTHSEEAFNRSLGYQAELGLTKADLPPPVWDIYQKAKLQFMKESSETLSINPDIANPTKINNKVSSNTPAKLNLDYSNNLNYPLRSSALKSVIFPGWGHLSDGRKSGKIIIATEIVMIAGSVFTAIQANEARDQYLKARNHTIIEEKYDKYNQLSRLSKTLSIGAVGTYLLAQFDFFRSQKAGISSLGIRTPYLLSFTMQM